MTADWSEADKSALLDMIRDVARRRNLPVAQVLAMAPADFAAEGAADARRDGFRGVSGGES